MQIKTYHHTQISSFLPTLHKWHATLFEKAPWNYVPPKGELISPTHTIFVNDPHSILVTIEKGDTILGMLFGVPLDSFFLKAHALSEQTLKLWTDKGYQLGHIFYSGGFYISSQIRHDPKLIQAMYDQFCAHAKKIGKDRIAYMEILSEHPQVEPWQDVHANFKSTGIAIDFPWTKKQPDGSVKEETSPMMFYINTLE